MSADDLGRLFGAQEKVKRWRAELENASARVQLAKIEENTAYLLSQYEPVNSLKVNRDVMRVLFNFLQHGDIKRLEREAAEIISRD